MNFSELTRTAVDAALLAGAYLKEKFSGLHSIRYKEGKQNLVTESDLGSEERILSRIRKTFPNHDFLAEESGQSIGNGEVLWIIDPLDGTVNFARNIPHFSVSIAATIDGSIETGVILDPLSGELFVAEKNKGSFLGSEKLKVSTVSDLSSAILATGFPYNVEENPMRCIDTMEYFLKQGIPIRRFGSAALDLAYVAAGRFDAYWETELNPWDIAAGILLIREAGGKVSLWDGSKYDLRNRSPLLASNGSLHSIMIDSLAKGRCL